MTTPQDINLKHKIWATALVFIVFIIGAVIIISANSTFTFRIEMDNNTLEAMKLINYTALQ